MSDLTSQPPMLGLAPDIHGLEADLAYFEARLSLLTAAPDSLYQRAQLRTYSALEAELHGKLDRLRRSTGKKP